MVATEKSVPEILMKEFVCVMCVVCGMKEFVWCSMKEFSYERVCVWWLRSNFS